MNLKGHQKLRTYNSNNKVKTEKSKRTPLAVQWLRPHTSIAGSVSLIPGQGTRIPTCCAVWPKKSKASVKIRGDLDL